MYQRYVYDRRTAHGAAERMVMRVVCLLSGLLSPCRIAVHVSDGAYVRYVNEAFNVLFY